MTVVFTAGITINKPRDIVAKALMIPENFPFWQTGLERFEVLEKKPGETGSIGRLHYRQKGRSYFLEDRLLYCEPEKKYVSQVTGDAITARVVTTLSTEGTATGMSVTWSGKGKSIVLKLLFPLLRGRMIRQTQTELETFKHLVETRGSDFS